MTATDAIHRLTSSYDIGEFAEFASGEGPFLSVVLPAASDRHDADHVFGVRWKNARRDAAELWSADALDALDQVVADVPHDSGESIAIFDRADGEHLVVPMSGAVRERLVHVGSHPRLVPLVEDRQRTLPHLVVTTDRTGADLVGFADGQVVATDDVEGDTEHIHRSRGGGWSHRRFQQRVENTWEQNASDVADAVVELAQRVSPLLVVVAGEVRARHLVSDALDSTPVAPMVSVIEEGSADEIADATVRLVDDQHARLQRDVLDDLRSGDAITRHDDVLSALREGRVDTLLVNDLAAERDDERHDSIDRAVVEALRTSARIVVLPRTSELSDGLAAVPRW